MSRYAGLGFDPTPGNVDSVRALAERLAEAGRAVADATDLTAHAVATSAWWQGAAADEFRRPAATLSPRLHGHENALTSAADVLFAWGSTLADLQRQAEQYDRQARRLTGRIADAQQLVDEWTTAVSVASTHVRPQAEATLATHHRTLAALQAKLAPVVDAAQRLAAEHRSAADRTAARLRELTDSTSTQPPVSTSLPALVTDIGALLTSQSEHARQASAAAGLALATTPSLPHSALGTALAAMTEPGTGPTWTFWQT